MTTLAAPAHPGRSTPSAWARWSIAIPTILLLLTPAAAVAEIDQDLQYHGPSKAEFDAELDAVLRWAVKEMIAEDLDYCQRRATGRSAGKRAVCKSGYKSAGAKCVKDECPPDFENKGGKKCRAVCPAGFRDDGLYCKLREDTYGRGIGRSKKKCADRYGASRCEKHGLLWYKKCKSGYENFGSNLCRTSKPDCGAYANAEGRALFDERLDLSCKKSTFSPETIGKQCPDGYTRGSKGTLCYKKCSDPYRADGLFCRQKCTSNHPKKCGAGYCARSTADCVKAVGQQTLAVATFLVNARFLDRYEKIASLQRIAGAAASSKVFVQGASAAWSTSFFAYELTLDAMLEDFDYPQSVRDAIANNFSEETGKFILMRLNAILFSVGHEKYPGETKKKTRDKLLVLASLEPTGVVELFRTFYKPKCDPNLFPTELDHLKAGSLKRNRAWWIPTDSTEYLEQPLRGFPARFNVTSKHQVTFPQNMRFPMGAQGRICRAFDNGLLRIGTQVDSAGPCITARHEKKTTQSYPLFDLLTIDRGDRLTAYSLENVPAVWAGSVLMCRVELDTIDFEDGINGQIGIGYVHGGKCWVPEILSDTSDGRVIGVEPADFEVLVVGGG